MGGAGKWVESEWVELRGYLSVTGWITNVENSKQMSCREMRFIKKNLTYNYIQQLLLVSIDPVFEENHSEKTSKA